MALSAKKKEEAAITAPAFKESVYTAGELAACSKELFGARSECVTASMKEAGKERATVKEAREIIQRFLSKEVK